MLGPLEGGGYLFDEIDEDLLVACEDGAVAELWTKPEMDNWLLYLQGSEPGKGLLAVMPKDRNAELARVQSLGLHVYITISKRSPTSFKFDVKTRTQEEQDARTRQRLIEQARTVSGFHFSYLNEPELRLTDELTLWSKPHLQFINAYSAASRERVGVLGKTENPDIARILDSGQSVSLLVFLRGDTVHLSQD